MDTDTGCTPEREPLLKKTEDESLSKSEETGARGVEKSHLTNLLFVNLVLFMLTLASHFHSPVQSQYLYRRVFQDEFGNSSLSQNSLMNQTCFLNTSDPGYILQEKAQAKAADLQMQYTMMKSAIGIITNILLGAYSDVVGRKILFMIPFLGHFLRYGCVAVIIYWDLDLNFFFLSEGIDGLSGGYYAILLACYTYTADNTPASGSRTMGIAIVEACESLGGAASSTAAGYFIQDTGFFYPQLTAAVLVFVDSILIFFFLPETPGLKTKKGSGCISPWKAFKQVFGFYFLEGSGRKKACFVLAMVVFIFTCIPGVGGSNIDTLYKLNLPFCWSPEMIGMFGTITSVIQQVVGLPFIRLLQCCCIDEVIGAIGSFAIAAGDSFQGFAYNDMMMYAVSAIKIPAVSLFPVCRAMMSKMAPANKQGSLFASIAAIETLCSVVGTPIFSYVYQLTVTEWRGEVFQIMAGVHVIATVFFVIFIFVSKPERQKQAEKTLRIQAEDEEEKIGGSDYEDDKDNKTIR